MNMSISFRLGKASSLHGGNIGHNNREFFAENIDKTRTKNNLTYVKKDVRKAYDELFSESVAEYNCRQTRKDRRIENYYEHIEKGKREEVFYEIVVQVGNGKTACCGSEGGKIAEKILDDYMREFRKRNKNLFVFNAVLHLDELSPHIHIDFIPFYDEQSKRQIGLHKGVSLKSALDEQGFSAKNFKQNRLVAWEESERKILENLLLKNGITHEIANSAYSYLDVAEFKKVKDVQKIIANNRSNLTAEKLNSDVLRE